MKYDFNGESHTISEAELESICSTGRCSLALYIAPPEDKVETWLRIHLDNERKRDLAQHKVTRGTAIYKRFTQGLCRTTRKMLNTELERKQAIDHDKSPTFEPLNYTKEERAKLKIKDALVEGRGYRVLPATGNVNRLQ